MKMKIVTAMNMRKTYAEEDLIFTLSDEEFDEVKAAYEKLMEDWDEE